MVVVGSGCDLCENLYELKQNEIFRKCKAYPDGIPQKVLLSSEHPKGLCNGVCSYKLNKKELEDI